MLVRSLCLSLDREVDRARRNPSTADAADARDALERDPDEGREPRPATRANPPGGGVMSMRFDRDPREVRGAAGRDHHDSLERDSGAGGDRHKARHPARIEPMRRA